MGHYPKITKPLVKYRSYVCQLIQSGPYAPQPTILQNDLGYNPEWVRIAAGDYRLASTELSNENVDKVVVFFNIGKEPTGPMAGGFMGHAVWNREQAVVFISTAYYDGSTAGYSLADDLLSDLGGDDFWRASFELRIYY